MITVDVEQNTRDWFLEKLGLPSASNFDKIITPKGEVSKQRQKYLYQLAGQKVSGIQEPTFQSQAMLRGIEVEKEARAFYELITDAKVRQVGVCFADEQKIVGCSPDGLVGKSGLIEIKCPEVHTHVSYLLKGVVPDDYIPQIQGQLFVTGRSWVDFMSYYPGIKPLIVRVKRDKTFIAALERELLGFCAELKDVIAKIGKS